MSLFPSRYQSVINLEDELTNETVQKPSLTYLLDLENGTLSRQKIDGETAIRQFIQKTIKTARFRYLIYGDEYGCELEELIGQDVTLELLEQEVPRVITEALIYDDRISDVGDFVIVRTGGTVHISFTVTTVTGQTLIEEVSA
jgi:phage baseplate assembly protein W